MTLAVFGSYDNEVWQFLGCMATIRHLCFWLEQIGCFIGVLVTEFGKFLVSTQSAMI